MPADYLSYYNGKKVFLTGHTGFKGSWLMAALHQAGSIIRGYALQPEYEGLFGMLEPSNVCESIIDDIRNKENLKEAIISFEPDFIFHLAAQPLVRRSYEIPAETFEINVIGTANLLEIVGGLKNKCTLVVVTTDKVYENKEQDVLYNEDDKLGGYDPYSASKACTELVVSSFRNSFFNTAAYKNHFKAIATARAGNVIGGGDRSCDRIVPDIVRHLEHDESIPVRNPNAIRPWQHVLEPLSGYLMLGRLLDEQPEKFSRAYNFGPAKEDHLTVRELVETAIQIWGNGKWVDDSDQNQVHEAGLLKLDITLAENDLNWHPRLSSKEAIEWTINWYKKPKSAQLAYTFNQVKEFFR